MFSTKGSVTLPTCRHLRLFIYSVSFPDRAYSAGSIWGWVGGQLELMLPLPCYKTALFIH